ncbi:MAG: hypothetical protein H6995_04460 [Pseudomonadales bacterium]|nr:hypothetical protein [Pseudomonadales bacterium]
MTIDIVSRLVWQQSLKSGIIDFPLLLADLMKLSPSDDFRGVEEERLKQRYINYDPENKKPYTVRLMTPILGKAKFYYY